MKRTTFIPLSLALAASAFADNTFYFNEAGYDSDQPISIVVKSTDNLEGQKWTLWFDPDGGMTGASVATGTFGAGGSTPSSLRKNRCSQAVSMWKWLRVARRLRRSSSSVIRLSRKRLLAW